MFACVSTGLPPLVFLLPLFRLSCCRGSCFRPARRVAKYSQRRPRLAHLPQIGFSLSHLIFDTAQELQLSRSLLGSLLGSRGDDAIVDDTGQGPVGRQLRVQLSHEVDVVP